MGLKWTDVHEIGFHLSEAHPDRNPLEVRFTDLLRLVRELPGFDDDPAHGTERVLEAVQVAWLEELD